MKYTRKNNKNSLEIMKEEKNNLITDDFDTSEYLDEEFVNKKKLFRGKKQEYEYIIDEDAEEEKIVKKETKKVPKKEKPKKEKKTVTKKQEEKEEPILTIEPIRKVTKEEYKDITRKRQEEKEKQLKLEQEDYEKKKRKNTKRKQKSKQKPFKLNIKMVINIIFVLILFIIAITVVDIVSVTKYEKGPYFAINTATYKDGGTKVYHGIGYKVIKYNQLQGRRDMEIGTWSLKYNIEPITTTDIDLSIEFNNDEETTYNNYYKKFVRINSTLKKVNKNNNTIIIGYDDEDGKYTMNIICKMANENIELDNFEVGKEITIIGTIKEFNQRTSTNPIIVKISDCFAEQ